MGPLAFQLPKGVFTATSSSEEFGGNLEGGFLNVGGIIVSDVQIAAL